MPIEITCGCGKRYRAKDELLGSQVSCPACGGQISVPASPSTQSSAPGQQQPGVSEKQQIGYMRHLNRVRFVGDAQGATTLVQQPEIAHYVQLYGQEEASNSARKELLANAVRVDEDILPDLGSAFDEIRRRTGIKEEMECYVYHNPSIDACVFKSRDHWMVLLSSAAIEKLTAEELEFVVGHEIGHVAYDHFKIPVSRILQSEEKIAPKHAIDLLSWHRHAEISADRAGLLCCGSLEVAASAFFKVLSGLSLPHMKVNPLKFASQFDHLREEIFREGAEEMWTLTHPLSPLRMKSMNIFWESEDAKTLVPGAPGGRSRDACDREINDLLSYMDPRARRGDAEVDPMLEPFLTWGGLIVAGSDQGIHSTELDALASVVGQHNVDRALKEPKKMALYRQRFQEALNRREHPLSALDINRILTCLIAVVRADGRIERSEIKALHALASLLGVAPGYVDSLLNEL